MSDCIQYISWQGYLCVLKRGLERSTLCNWWQRNEDMPIFGVDFCSCYFFLFVIQLMEAASSLNKLTEFFFLSQGTSWLIWSPPAIMAITTTDIPAGERELGPHNEDWLRGHSSGISLVSSCVMGKMDRNQCCVFHREDSLDLIATIDSLHCSGWQN